MLHCMPWKEGGGCVNQDDTSDCLNISSMKMRNQREHRVRDGAKEDQRRRRDRASHWIASKGNDLVGNGGSSRRGSKRGKTLAC